MDQDTDGIPRLSKREPKLVSSLCFEWGRAVRIQWCPIPLTVGDHIGLLAMLTGDGKVRVVTVKRPSQREQADFGECLVVIILKTGLTPCRGNPTADCHRRAQE
jgi:transcription factor C subunit 6